MAISIRFVPKIKPEFLSVQLQAIHLFYKEIYSSVILVILTLGMTHVFLTGRGVVAGLINYKHDSARKQFQLIIRSSDSCRHLGHDVSKCGVNTKQT